MITNKVAYTVAKNYVSLHLSVVAYLQVSMLHSGYVEVSSTACYVYFLYFFFFLTEMGVMPEIAQAVEEMDWL